MDKNSLITDLTTGSTSKKLLTFSWPFMLSNLLQALYNMVDMAVVGNVIGSAGLAAVSNGGELMAAAMMVCMGFSAAGQVIISQCVGRGDSEGRRRAVGSLFTFTALLAVLLGVAGLIFVEDLLGLLNVPVEAFDGAMEYSLVCLLGMFFIAEYNAVSAILRGMGDSKRPMYFVALAAVANLVLDLLFVAVLDMGVAGAALATVMGQGLSFVCSIVYLYKKREAFGFDFKARSFLPAPDAMKAIIKLGLPISLQTCAISFSRMFVSAYINEFGVVASAVTGVGHKINQCAMIICNALSTAATSMIGQCLGAGKLERIPRVVKASVAVGFVWSIALTAVVAIFPERVFGLFTSESEVLAMSRMYVPIAVIGLNAYPLRSALLALTNGVGNTVLSLIAGLIDGFFGRVVLAILLGVVLDMGIMGFWVGDVAAGYIPFIVCEIYFLSGKWKTRAPVMS